MNPGDTLGPYEIVSLLGEGGMGSVYKARDPRLGRFVAIKVSRAQFSERFEREARSIAALNHPNICTLHDVGPNYLVMELIEGLTLAGRIQQSKFQLDDALPILRQLVDAVEAAHEKNITHRDLKPDNIKITPQGVVKVLDFGLAKAMETPAPSADPANATTLRFAPTVAGMIMGTPSYMAPEQASGQASGKRADVWAFGVIALEMFTGKIMFAGETVVHILADVMNKPFTVDGAPVQLQPLLKRCLVRDENKRMRDIGEARLELEKIASGDVEAAPAPPKPRRWQLAAAVLALAAIGLAAFAWQATRPVERPLAMLPLDVVLVRDNLATPLAVSPDGTKIVFRGGTQDSRRLFVRHLNQDAAVPLPGTDGASLFFFSPDGNWVAFAANGKLKKTPVHGGPTLPICDIPLNAPHGATWGEDGNIVTTLGTNAGLSLVPADGGKPVPLTELSGKELSHRHPYYLPGGKAVLFMSGPGGPGSNYNESNIEVLSLKDRKRKLIRRGGYGPSYLASGHVTYLFEGTLFAVPFDLSSLEATAAPVPVLTAVQASVSGAATFHAAKDGTAIYIRGGRTTFFNELEVGWGNSDGSLQALFSARVSGTPAASPDGTQILYRRAGDNDFALFAHDIRRSVSRRLVLQNSVVMSAWMPDSLHILYADRNGVYWMRADGSGTPVRLFDRPYYSPAISPDGKHLLLSEDELGPGKILHVVLEMEAGAPKAGKPAVWSELAYLPAFSPDGKFVSYSDGRNIFVRPFPAQVGLWQISNDRAGGAYSAWSRSAKQLFYASISAPIQVVDYAVKGGSFEAGESRRWGSSALRISAAPAGKQLLIMRTAGQTEDSGQTFVLMNFLDEVRRRVREKK
ncbi:MAG: serine/threonine-protein kinase [Candidatus Solibacter usitatus]|nr:serine/threonine-protein kinase [Candidatus Solibacter usitatus]